MRKTAIIAFIVPMLVAAALLGGALLGAETASAQTTTTDYDDNDGLIDVKILTQLDAVRYDADGNGDGSTHTNGMGDSGGTGWTPLAPQVSSLPQAQSASAVSRISFGASPRSGNTYRSGDAIRVTVKFSSAVTVTGTPQLELTIGSNRRQADYFYGSGSRNLKFSYTVQAADRDTNGVSIAANALSLNSGTIRAGTQDATLTHTGVADDATRKVDGGGGSTDYDTNDNGLIDVDSLAKLNAIRWDADGNGAVDGGTSNADTSSYNAAFPNAVTGMGCPSAGCTGYELVTDLDFDQDADGQITSADFAYWNNGAGWNPIQRGISVFATGFAGIFDGNHKNISNLYMVSRAADQSVGLFGQVASGGTIRNVRLAAVRIDRTGNFNSVGGLAGKNAGTITASYVTGRVSSTGNNPHVGGLVGENTGTIAASYSTATVAGGTAYSTGGLVGYNWGGEIIASYATGATSGTRNGAAVGGLAGTNRDGAITASYATGYVSGAGNTIGGLVGFQRGQATAVSSYYDTETTGRSSSAGGVSQTTSQLQTPIAYGSGNSIYAGWNVDVDNADNDNNLATQPDNPWNFGGAGQYPMLRYFAAGSVPPKPSFGSASVAAQSYAQNVAITALTLPQAAGGNGTASYTLTPALPVGLVHNPPVAGAANGGTITGTPTVSSGAITYTLTAHDADTDRVPDDAATLTFTIAITRDYDLDNDGLIEVDSLAQLDAVRWDLNGDGSVDTGTSVADTAKYNAAFPRASTGMGCLRDHDDDTTTAKVAGCVGYELTQDLDFDTDGDGATYTTSSAGVVTGDAGDTYYSGGKGWSHIGFYGGPRGTRGCFTATFDGNDKIIANLFIKNTAAVQVGLFGCVGGEGSRVERLGVRNVNVTGRDAVGGLVGYSWGTISASYATGSVTAIGGGVSSGRAGGLVGYNSGPISASYATGSVTGNYSVGGLAGRNLGTITASYATGSVTGTNTVGGLVGSNMHTITASYATGSVTGNDYVGGLVGFNGGNSGKVEEGTTITASYATGSVTGNDYVGGLVGSNTHTITASYATGSVTGNDYVGGLAGSNASNSSTLPRTVTNSYATGTVKGTGSNVGGLVGSDQAGSAFRGTATNSYWDTGTTGQAASAGGAGKTSRDLQSPAGYSGIYAAWNTNLDGVAGNDDPWDFGANRQHPVLNYGGLAPSQQRRTAIRSDNWNAPVVGEPVVASLDVTGATGITWQWQSSTNGSTWTDIANATSATYIPVTAAVGKYLRAKATFTVSGSSRTLATVNTAKVTAATTAAAATAVPGLVPVVGGGIRYDLPVTGAANHTWRWQRCHNAGMTTNCAAVAASTAATTEYTPVAGDVGKYLRAYAYYAANDAGKTWTRTETPVLGPVVAAPAPPASP